MSQNKPTVLIADSLASSLIDSLKTFCRVIVNASLSGEKLVKSLETYQPNVLVVRSTKVQKEHFQAAKSLALIVRAGAGINTIDVKEASRRGVFVANCPGKNAIAVAELCMGHLINLDRSISDNVNKLRNGIWAKKQFSKTARGLYGLKMAVLGCGQVGEQLIKRAKSFGIEVTGWDKFLPDSKFKEMQIHRSMTALEACKNADIVSVHLPLVKDTKNLINKELISVMNDNAYILNTSRGGIVNENDIIEMIKIKNIKVGLDVLSDEPKSTDKTYNNNKIKNNPNIYVTHHIGASTKQASNAVANEVLNIISNYFKTGTVKNCVNLERHTPAKYLLSIRHEDCVGVLAFILSHLRQENINIQSMNNIIFDGAKAACAKLQLDSKPSNNILHELQSHVNIYDVELVKLRKSKL